MEEGSSLQSETAFLNLVVENIPAMVAVKDAEELRFVLLNRHGEELTGIPREELLGKNDFDFFPPDQAEKFVAADRAVLESGKLTVIEEESITTRHKGVRYLRTLKMSVPDASGTPRYLLAMSEDITERKAAEEALQASQAMFGGVMEASPDALLAIDDDGYHPSCQRTLPLNVRLRARGAHRQECLDADPAGSRRGKQPQGHRGTGWPHDHRACCAADPGSHRPSP